MKQWEKSITIRKTEDFLLDIKKAKEKHGHTQDGETIKIAVKRYANED